MEKIIQKITKNKIFLNNDEIIDVNPDIIHYFKLKKDMDISNIYQDILFEAIKQKAMFYIYLKNRTKYELKSKLKEKYQDISLINEVISNLEENNYIDDVDYALSYILINKNSKQKNMVKLMQKGISKKDIELAYEEVPEEKEIENLEREIEKLLNKNIDKNQIFIKLTRKGYIYQDIKDTLKNLE